MIGLLRTACGCESKPFEFDPRHGWERKVPLLFRGAPSFSEPPEDPGLLVPIVARRFVHKGRRQGEACLFEEYDHVEATKPGPPHELTAGEWADACARFSAITRGDIHLADMEFLRRHDGATILAHKSGALIGAFYVAPSWDNSRSAVAIFSQLRQIIEEREGV